MKKLFFITLLGAAALGAGCDNRDVSRASSQSVTELAKAEVVNHSCDTRLPVDVDTLNINQDDETLVDPTTVTEGCTAN